MNLLEMNKITEIEKEINPQDIDSLFSEVFDHFLSSKMMLKIYGMQSYTGFYVPLNINKKAFFFFPIEDETKLENLKTVFTETRGILGLILDGFFIFPEDLKLKEILSIFNKVFSRGVEFVMKNENKIAKLVHYNNPVDIVKNFGYLISYYLKTLEPGSQNSRDDQKMQIDKKHEKWVSGLCYNCKVRVYPKGYLEKINTSFLSLKVNEPVNFSNNHLKNFVLVVESMVFLKKT